MILKSGTCIFNHCISNFEIRIDLYEREKTYFKDVIEKRKSDYRTNREIGRRRPNIIYKVF